MKDALLITAALLAGAALPAHADSWTAATRFSGPSFGGGSSVAIDAAGNAVATWSQRTTCGGSFACDLVWSRARPKGGQWGPVAVVSKVDPVLHANATTVKMSKNGAATAFWTDDNGLNTADKPLGGAWAKPVLLAAGVTYNNSIAISEDRLGEIAVLVYGTVTIRRSDGLWRQPVRYAPSAVAHVNPADVAISVGGDVVVSWESYDLKCLNSECYPLNYVLHASRLRYGSTTWHDSGPLTSPDKGAHGGRLAIDDAGRAGALIQVDLANSVRVQGATGGVWSAPTALPVSGVVNGFASDAAGDATVLLTDGKSGQVVATGGSLGGGAFAKQAVLSGNDRSPMTPLLAVSPSGSATAIWSYGDPNYSPKTIAVAARATATAPWNAQQNISRVGAQSAEVGAVAASGVGQSAATWIDYDNAITYSRVNGNVHRP